MATLNDFSNAIKTKLDGKAPVDHDHTSANISDFAEAAQDAVAALIDAFPATQAQAPALERLRALRAFGVGEVRVAVVGDSTGNEDIEWVRLWSKKYGALLPSSVRRSYRSWNSVNGGWRPEVIDASPVGVQVLDNFNRTGTISGSAGQTGPAWAGTNGWTGDGTTASTTVDSVIYQTLPSREIQASLDISAVTLSGTGKTQTLRIYIGSTTGFANNGVFLSMMINDTSGAVNASLHFQSGSVTTLVPQKPVAGVVSNSATVQPIHIEYGLTGTQVTTLITCAGQTTELNATLTAGDLAALGTIFGFSALGVPTPGFALRLDSAQLGVAAGGGAVFDMQNGSIAGATLATFNEAKRLEMFGTDSHFDLLVLNVGHNYGGTGSGAYLSEIETWLDAWGSEHPGCAVLLMSQNPQFLPAVGVASHAARLAALRVWAAENGYDYVPVFEAFAAEPDGGRSLVAGDGVHPTNPPEGTSTGDYGSVVWADTVLAATS